MGELVFQGTVSRIGGKRSVRTGREGLGPGWWGRGLGSGKGEWEPSTLPHPHVEGLYGCGMCPNFTLNPRSQQEIGPNTQEVELAAPWAPSAPEVAAGTLSCWA